MHLRLSMCEVGMVAGAEMGETEGAGVTARQAVMVGAAHVDKMLVVLDKVEGKYLCCL